MCCVYFPGVVCISPFNFSGFFAFHFTGHVCKSASTKIMLSYHEKSVQASSGH